MSATTSVATPPATTHTVDAVVVGAGMAGLYLLHRCREMGINAVALEAGDDVGGTWYWNRYPGARCDIESVDYSYSFDPELEQEWEWSERYATQPEILRYLQHVAERHDLRRDIRFETRVDAGVWNEDTGRWAVTTEAGDVYDAQWYIMATGCLSVPKEVDIPGADSFAGPTYVTGRWPHEGVDFTGQRVAVIGSGSSAIQSIPLIAEQASQITIYQRTPNYSLPAGNGPLDPAKVDDIKGRYREYRNEARLSRAGVPFPQVNEAWWMLTEEERAERLEAGYPEGILGYGSRIADLGTNPVANDGAAEFVRNKVRAKVDDPELAETLVPQDYPIFTKRLCLDTNYYETFNRDHVELVDLRKNPFVAVNETGIENTDAAREFDAIVYATGFDAMTGAIVSVDIEGRDGQSLKQKWEAGPQTYLGLMTRGFPNLFMITGPQSPSVLSNMAVSIEQHVEWVTDCIAAMRDEGTDTLEPTETAEAGWQVHVADCASITMFEQTDSWYMGANVPGKPRVFLPYVGGVGNYRAVCDDVVAQDWIGFERSGSAGDRCADGLIRELQLDVSMLLQAMVEMELPALDSMSADEAREFAATGAAAAPPGPEVGEVIDGTFPGADGNDLDYRLYRPEGDGPHPVIVYWHGGGWVIGSYTSNDGLCRDLCVRTGAMVISCDYRHAPDHPFPAPVDDAWAALQWIDANRGELGATDETVLAGWSAGANLAAVVSHRARDEGGPALAGQVLITPVTDCDMTRASYTDNGDGYVLTTSLMNWFWDHYCPEDQRSDPRASPIRGDLTGLAPTIVATAQFDPLRDEGAAYVEALQAAGSPATHLPQRGQIHTTIGAVGTLISPASCRAEIAEAITDLLA
jgi:cation diffusion facilitator CzcD-associated flavoprotein CzcO/acetyl esterase/lipase